MSAPGQPDAAQVERVAERLWFAQVGPTRWVPTWEQVGRTNRRHWLCEAGFAIAAVKPELDRAREAGLAERLGGEGV